MSAYRRTIPAEAAGELERLSAVLENYRLRSAALARELAEQIHACLHAGATWGEVGERLGMTKQGARDHWGRYIQGMMDERTAPARPPQGLSRPGRRPGNRSSGSESQGDPPP